ncbi:MAG: hypothetical protein NVS1B6_20800 [Steroidobacteraceae bacterium]
MRRYLSAFAITSVIVPLVATSQSSPTCYATPTSITPASWRAPPRTMTAAPVAGLKLVREIPLPGPPNRFDHQSVDPELGRIYMNHMNAGRTVVFGGHIAP